VRASAVPAFYRGLYAWLLRNADLVSSDGSFVPPVICGPELVLCLFPCPGDELGLSWKFAYQIDGWQLYATLPRDMPDEEYRSPAAEDALLRRLDLPVRRYRLGFPGQCDESVPKLTSPTRLTGQHMTRFVTELLPWLARQPRVRVEVSHDPLDDRETASSLRITAATDEAAGHKDWFDLDVPISVAGHPVPFREVFLALNCGDRYLQLADGTHVSLDQPELRALAEMIEKARVLNDPIPSPSGRFQDEFLNELAALGVPEDEALAWREKVLRLTSHDPSRLTQPPAGLRAELRPHQQSGFDWLVYLWENQLGGILADEMGLGKTLQCLALINHVRKRHPAGAPFLIVVPKSVVANWADEAARFTPDLSVMPITSTVACHGGSLDGLIEGTDAVITTYNLLRLDYSTYEKRPWSGLLLDEAQAVKNLQSDIYDRVRRLPAPVKIAITGTPLENNTMELWSLLSITAPGLFPRPDRFFSQYARPIEDEGDNERVVRLQRLIGPLLMRRTKDQGAAELPPKREHVLEVHLHGPHRDVYQTWLQRERQKILGLDDDILVNRFTILRSLTRLRQLSLHAGLIDDAYADLPSAKIDALLAKLCEVTGGEHKALVFSQFTGFLGKVRERLEAEGLPYCYLDGHTRDRADVVRKFKAGAAPVFLISLKAGGTGLNLTEADHAFLLDPWWNPATEAQAIDRIHRIGQTRDVSVYRLVAMKTVEEKVRLLQARKAQLFASIMSDGRGGGGTLNLDDIRSVLS
jgi:SNF2 family DNA or RNA helicase